MNTWLENFIEQSDLNQYPIVLRTEGGIGFQVGGDTVSNFVGHPVHYMENNEMKPITLNYIPLTGEFEGSWFGWDAVKKCPTYCGYELYTPRAIVWNGIAYPLSFLRLENRMIADIPIGTYEIIYWEGGMREVVTIPDPVEGTLVFDTPEQAGWDEYLYINPRKILDGSQTGNSYIFTKDMNYPVVIDPDYTAGTADGYVQGGLDATYSIARGTSTAFDSSATEFLIDNSKSGANYIIRRGAVLFGTSGIPDTDTVTQVNMKLTVTAKTVTGTDFDVQIAKYDWSASNPISAANRETVFDGILAASRDSNTLGNSSTMTATNQYTSGNLDTAWVSKTASTYYGIQNSRDYNNVTPTALEQLTFATQENATSANRPILTVVHGAASGTGFFLFF